MTAPVYIRVWARVPHGKKTRNEMVVAGAIPMEQKIPRRLHFEIKRQVREEWTRTGRIVPAKRVAEMIAVAMLAEALE